MFQVKLSPGAIFPTKAHESDVGYDVTIIKHIKTEGDVSVYDTGVAIAPTEKGYYVEIVPRSSFYKSGYILANSLGIIDPDYRGTIRVALVKVDKEAEDISLPYKGFQLIVRKLEDSVFVEVDDLNDTQRGTGGFGSTGK